jgi:benzoyl-CoA reductase subunit C
MTTQQILAKCKNLISQPDFREAYLLNLKNKYRGITGYFSNYIPEEIIAAAGFHPLRIIGFYGTSKSPQPSLFNPVCSFAKDIYSAACSGEFSLLSNIIFPNSCDSLRVLRQMWEYDIKKPVAHTLLHPINADSNSIHYFAGEIEAFAEKMKKDAGIKFTEAELKKTIDKYNQTRGLLRKLYDIRKNNIFLNGSDAIALMTAGLIMDRDEYNKILHLIIEEGKKDKHNDGNLRRIMIIGPLVDNYILLNKIEELGTYIICDSITNGARYYDLDVEIQGDLYENIAKRYLLSGPSPTLNSNEEVVNQHFQKMIRELDLHGVIFINQKFCEPHVHNYLTKIDIMKEMNINFLMLEIEHGKLEPDERDLLRIESFIEIAGRN